MNQWKRITAVSSWLMGDGGQHYIHIGLSTDTHSVLPKLENHIIHLVLPLINLNQQHHDSSISA
jgi:hypothetical protein